MTRLPIIAHYQATPTADRQAAVESLAEQLFAERPELADEEQFRSLRVDRIEDAPTLHLDDLSDIPLLDRAYDVTFMQDRARLRAGEGDFVASCTLPDKVYQEYCHQNLGLGRPAWLRARAAAHPLRLAYACWEDRQLRRTLVRALRSGGLTYVHPHMGTFPVWELAALLHGASRQPIKVIAPPPGVTKFANDKIAFAETAGRLFGPQSVPPTEQACNFAILAQRVRDLATGARDFVVKLPDSAGGGGNLVLSADPFRDRSLQSVRKTLKALLTELGWQGEGPVLVGSWESEVVCAPSAQLWIPPESAGPPMVEGLFEQAIVGREGVFVGSRPADFPDDVAGEIANRSWLLARLYQRLGYVGRCSFDMLLVGKSLERSRLEFIECNGRWGGTSIPMTLMNRIFGDWTGQPYAARECMVRGLDRLTFAELLDFLADDLFDRRTRRGQVILYNPGRMQAHSAINVLVLGDSWDEAEHRVREQIPRRLRELVAQAASSAARPAKRS